MEENYLLVDVPVTAKLNDKLNNLPSEIRDGVMDAVDARLARLRDDPTADVWESAMPHPPGRMMCAAHWPSKADLEYTVNIFFQILPDGVGVHVFAVGITPWANPRRLDNSDDATW